MARTPDTTETQINVVLSRDLHAKFKATTALDQRSMVSVIVELIKKYIDKEG